MDIPVEAQIYQSISIIDDESTTTRTQATTKSMKRQSQEVVEEEEEIASPTEEGVSATRKWTSAVGQARPVGHTPRGPSSATLVDDPVFASAPQNARLCYGPEYAVGFAFLLTFFCLLLGGFTMRICCPIIRDVAEKHCGLTLTWGRQIDSQSSSSSSHGDNVYSTIGATKVTAVAVDPYSGGVYFGK